MVRFKPFLWLILALLTELSTAGIYVNPQFPALDGELNLKKPCSEHQGAEKKLTIPSLQI